MYPNHCFFVGGISLLLGMKLDAASSLFEILQVSRIWKSAC